MREGETEAGCVMPISKENQARYGKDWKATSLRIRERAGWCCEGSPAYPDCRAAQGEPHPDTLSRVILTVAHLDHVIEHMEDENLRALCQRCHLHHDRHHHAATRRSKLAIGDLLTKSSHG